MIFENVEGLLKSRDSPLFSSVLFSSSCIVTIIKTNGNDGVLDVIHMVNDFRADRKHLLLLVPTLNETMFKNITNNYDVTIEHRDEGNVNIILQLIPFLIMTAFTSIETDGSVIHSLCPTLGKRHAQIFNGHCPGHLQNPFGKEINISFIFVPTKLDIKKKCTKQYKNVLNDWILGTKKGDQEENVY